LTRRRASCSEACSRPYREAEEREEEEGIRDRKFGLALKRSIVDMHNTVGLARTLNSPHEALEAQPIEGSEWKPGSTIQGNIVISQLKKCNWQSNGALGQCLGDYSVFTWWPALFTTSLSD